MTEAGHVVRHPQNVTIVGVFSELLLREGFSLRTGSKPGEKESERRHTEEIVLRLLAVLVHCVAHSGEVDQRVPQEVVILVVAVRQHYQLHELDELKAGLRGQRVNQVRELEVDKRDERVCDGALLPIGLPLVEEWFVGQFEVQRHRPEARALEEEVKVLVVVPLALFRSARRSVTPLFALFNLA